jgi:3-isopropylmalate/(R)-2-methylmalate dehydratase small subunit
MTMAKIGAFTAPTVVLPVDNVDTDQIIPARFLKGTSRSGLGRSLFADWRYDAQGAPRPDFVLNRAEAKGAEILVAGDNFGCGSSREHAPWALVDAGFRAVISTSIADIFRNNALKNGLLPIVVDPVVHRRLLAQAGASVTVDLEAQAVTLSDGTRTQFEVEPFARYCLLSGMDELTFLLSQTDAIAAYERAGQP